MASTSGFTQDTNSDPSTTPTSEKPNADLSYTFITFKVLCMQID